MATDGRKAPAASPTPPLKTASSAKKLNKMRADEDATIKVASNKKDNGATSTTATKDKPNGILKLKKPPPKHKLPGNWKDGSFIDSETTLTLHYKRDHITSSLALLWLS